MISIGERTEGGEKSRTREEGENGRDGLGTRETGKWKAAKKVILPQRFHTQTACYKLGALVTKSETEDTWQ